MVFRFKNL